MTDESSRKALRSIRADRTDGPVRWADPRSDAPAELGSAVRAARERDGSDAQLLALRKRLGLKVPDSTVPKALKGKLLRFKPR